MSSPKSKQAKVKRAKRTFPIEEEIHNGQELRNFAEAMIDYTGVDVVCLTVWDFLNIGDGVCDGIEMMSSDYRLNDKQLSELRDLIGKFKAVADDNAKRAKRKGGKVLS